MSLNPYGLLNFNTNTHYIHCMLIFHMKKRCPTPSLVCWSERIVISNVVPLLHAWQGIQTKFCKQQRAKSEYIVIEIHCNDPLADSNIKLAATW